MVKPFIKRRVTKIIISTVSFKRSNLKKEQQYLAYLIGILAVFLINLVLLIISFTFVSHEEHASGIIGYYITHHIQFMILLAILGIAVGIISYKGFASQVRNIQHSIQVSKDILLKFLDGSERIVINYILDRPNEIITQANISRIKNMGKVKSHRTIARLVEKNIISLTPHGKTNRVELESELKELFSTK